MQVILKEDVNNLGYKGDIIDVKPGYARNFLIPTGQAIIATPAAKKMLDEELKQRAHKLEKIKNDALALAESLEGVSLTIATKVSATGTIFGSVTNIQIAEELEKGEINVRNSLSRANEFYKKHQDTDCSLSTEKRKKALKHLIIRVQWLYERVHLRYDLSIIKVVAGEAR